MRNRIDFADHMEKSILSQAELIDSYSININESIDNEIVIYVTRNMAKQAGFAAIEETMLATLASELATNIIRYAVSGTIIISIIGNYDINERKGLQIDAIDKGPGIENIALAMTEHFTSTAGSLGIGLSCVYNYMDEFTIESGKGIGTHITARKWC